MRNELVQPYFQFLGDPLPGADLFYRGTYRSGVSYDEGRGDNHPYNVAFLQYVNVGEKVFDLTTALSLYATIRQHKRVELVRLSAMPTANPGFYDVGYDVSVAGWYSFLAVLPTMNVGANPLRDYYLQKRNRFGLLDDFADAIYVRDAVRKRSREKNFFESPENTAVLEPIYLSVWKGAS